MDKVVPGKCLLLNDPSSVGKSSVARELKRILPGDWGIMSVDNFLAFAPAILQTEDPWFHLTDVPYPDPPARTFNDADFARMEELFPRFLALFHQCVADMTKDGFSVIVDHVFNCKAGAVHHDLAYDLIVDTTELSPRESAEIIRDYLEEKNERS